MINENNNFSDVYIDAIEFLKKHPDEYDNNVTKFYRKLYGDERKHIKNADDYEHLGWVYDELRKALKIHNTAIRLKKIGVDRNDREVYEDEEGNLYCDVNLTYRFGGKPEIATKYRNEFEGEPDMPVQNFQIMENKKSIIRLTESDLKYILTESVRRIIKERTKSEIGLTDDQVINKRLNNFISDNMSDNDQWPGDTYGYFDGERWRDKMDTNRLERHRQTQNHPKHPWYKPDTDEINEK